MTTFETSLTDCAICLSDPWVNPVHPRIPKSRCTIENCKDPKHAACAHIFCEACLTAKVKINAKKGWTNECPICRTSFDANKFIPYPPTKNLPSCQELPYLDETNDVNTDDVPKQSKWVKALKTIAAIALPILILIGSILLAVMLV